MASCPINILSLCSGGGGLDLGVELAIPDSRGVCYVEGESFAVAHLVEKMRAGALAPAPVWGDVRTFDGRPWRGVVDCIVGGYPCQPFSFAGKRGGSDDPRHLWPSIARIVAEVEPGIVFFENVSGHLTLGFDAVRADLRSLGFRVAAGLFTAEEVGAPHRRERLFILGVADGGGKRGREGERAAAGRGQDADEVRNVLANTAHDHRRGRERGAEEGTGTRPGGRGRPASGGGLMEHPESGDGRVHAGRGSQGLGEVVAGGGGADVGDAGRPSYERRDEPGSVGAVRTEREGQGTQRQRPRGDAGGASTIMADAADAGGRRQDAEQGPIGRGTAARAGGPDDLPLFPPGPGDLDAWRRILAEHPGLAPAVVATVRRVADGPATRLDELRCYGNSVVPVVAALAFVSLWACLRGD